MLSRTRAAVATAVAIFVAGSIVSAVSAGTSHHAARVSALPSLGSQIAARINVSRAQYGLPRIRVSPALRTAANAHTFEMVRDGYFSHDSADGTTAGKRLLHYYKSAGYRRWEVGEALLWYSPGVDAATAVHEWLTSPEHRAILLDPSFREIGVSAVHAIGGTGAFNGDEVTVVTADFGARSR